LTTVKKVQTVIAGYIGVAPADNDWKVGNQTSGNLTAGSCGSNAVYIHLDSATDR